MDKDRRLGQAWSRYGPTWRGILVLVGLALLTGCAATARPDAPQNLPPSLSPWPVSLPTVTPAPTATPLALDGPLTVALAPDLPDSFAAPLRQALSQPMTVTTSSGAVLPVALGSSMTEAHARVELTPWWLAGTHLAVRIYAAVVPFATLRDEISLDALQQGWQGQGEVPVLAAPETVAMLTPLLGPYAGPFLAPEELMAALEAQPAAVGILPFDRLHPRWKVLRVNGANPLDNRFDPATYPLTVVLSVRGAAAAPLAEALQPAIQPRTNRQADRLTTLLMTGVTAMSRGTAAAMERRGILFPTLHISDTLAAADITHISNEVPFLDDCVVNNTENNLILCSHTSYWAALEALGTDIVGLSGNHVNDFGREGARRSLQFYRERGIPIYGSGLNVEEACAPLLWEHNGNTFAFLAVLAFGPDTAWATEDEPGACYYYDHKGEILARVAQLSQQVDIVSVELQYLEIYEPTPTRQQVEEFRELRAAGADIVTGVQSHVPQALEPYGPDDPHGPGIIVYGLGNLFFDQMWSWETRTELMVRHTIYEGRLLGTEILTAVLEDYAQPRWATPEERAEILGRIFAAAPPRPTPPTPTP
ncbi:MAG: hypothetical protein KatS3mg050_0203 [Litorilinea sp.]|nr:MAG: hypothetical protein KatS3mg050_0203 [Litorilinea sp.]